MSDKKTLQDLLKELIAARGLNTDKLAAVSNIPSRFISLILDGRYKELPSKPYIRGYLIRIASVLNVDPDMLLESYDSSVDLPTSGDKDRLPVNRFQTKQMNRGLIAAAVIVIILIGVIAFRFNDIIGIPTIQVNVPDTTQSQTLHITGEVKPGDTITLNGQSVYPASDGTFVTDIFLNPGPNNLDFVVKRFLGRSAELTKVVVYQTQTASSTQISTTTQTH